MAIDTNINTPIDRIGGVQGRFHSGESQGHVEHKTGQGVAGTNIGDTPPAGHTPELADVYLPESYQAALDSIYELLGQIENGMASDEEEVLLVKLAKKMRDIGLNISKETSQLTKAQRMAFSEELKKIQEKVEEQINEAERQSKKSKIMGWFKTICSVVAAVALLVAAGAASIATGGLASPLMVAAACLVIVAVNDVVAQATGEGAISQFCQLCGASEEAAQWIELAVVIVLVVVAMVCTFGMSAPATAGTLACKVDKAAQLVGIIASLGEAAGTGTQAVMNHQIMNVQADAADNKSDMGVLQAFIELLDQLIKEVTDAQAEALMAFAENIGKASENLREKGNALTHAGANIGKFVA